MTAGRRPKVVLYNPRAVFYTMPLALVAIGSHLGERYEVVIVDGRFADEPLAALAPHLDDAVCVGMSVLTGSPIHDALEVSRRIKQRWPDLPIVWGGWHPSLFGRETLAEPAVDVSVQGQGEETFAEMVGRLADGGLQRSSLEGCHGCCWRDPQSGAVHREPPRTFRDINSFRRHDYALIDTPAYFRLKGKRQLDYISSQGCPFRCAFCADPFVFERKWSGLEPQRMGDEIEDLWQRYRFDDLSFQDETYFTYRQRVEAVADQLLARELPITWAATLRADQCSRLPEETLAKCKASGLRRVLVGVESGSQEMIDRIQKDIRLEQVFETAERCLKHRVAVIFPFIVGFPGETPRQVQASLDVAKRLRAMSPDFQTPIFYFKPYPGSPITTAAVADGFQLPASLEAWADFDFIGTAGPWVSPQLYRKVERFKFYQEMSWNRGAVWRRPIEACARWRLRHDVYALPVERAVSRWLRPEAALS